jgi:hypothetical protein
MPLPQDPADKDSIIDDRVGDWGACIQAVGIQNSTNGKVPYPTTLKIINQ